MSDPHIVFQKFLWNTGAEAEVFAEYFPLVYVVDI